MRIRSRTFLPLLLAGLLVGCSSTAKPTDVVTEKPPAVNTDEQVLTSDPVERNYDPHVIMKRAEAFFEKEDYAEAAVEYQHFLDLHRSHMLAPYAQYRLGLSHFTQVTTHDRDPEHVRLAIEALEKLLKHYPGNAYELDAKAKIQESHAHRAAHELYVGRHYYRQAAYLAALHRFERVLAIYPDSDTSAEALYYLAKTYHDLGAPDRAVEHLTLLLTRYPQSATRKEGQALMVSLTGKPLEPLEYVAAAVIGAPAPSRSALPPPLPPAPLTRVLTDTPAALPPAGAPSHDPSIITCGLNVNC